MLRENFTSSVREQIAASAGHQCSFPTCNQRTVGPGPSSQFVSKSGYAAHIYAASAGGPRGQGGLTASELRGAGNGIWLCGKHAKLIDNNKGVAYPPETLLSYKALHEARVLLEHEGLYPPIGWLHELTVVQGPLFSTPQTLQLAKLNLIYGMNGTGKTAITEWINGFFDCQDLERWVPARKQPLNLRFSLLNPKVQNLRLTIDGTRVQYFIDGKSVAFIPIKFAVFKPQRPNLSIKDDLEMLSQALGIPNVVVEPLLEEVNSFPYATVSNLRLKREEGDEGEHRSLIADLHGTGSGLSLRALSGGELERVVMELITAAARLSGKYSPTLLILDGFPSIIFKTFFEFYSHHLLDPLNQFQTLMCIPIQNLDLDKIQWNGWQVIRTQGTAPHITLNQDPRKSS
jgi:hypothetical protein